MRAGARVTNIGAELRSLLGPDEVLTDPDVCASYCVDWTRRFSGSTPAVVRPRSVDEVAALVSWCANNQIALVPQGGNTGLVAGAVPMDGEVVVSLERLDAIDEVDTVAAQVSAQAGVTLGALQRAAEASGLEVPVDLAARDTATIGGMVATNAGGTRVLRYGSMRSNVVGIEAVLGTGRIIRRMGGLLKDNTGYDVAGLLCGSEGTLGVVTAVRLRLVPAWPDSAAVWVSCQGWADAVELAAALRSRVDGLDGLEAVDREGLMLARCHHLVVPLRDLPPVALLAVWRGRGEPPAALSEVVGGRPHAVALGTAEVNRFWEPRERMTETISKEGIPHKLDVSLPPTSLARFVSAVTAATAPHRLVVFGHLGDGNLHVNLLGPESSDESVDDEILQLVAVHGGSISAEHGIGRAKVRWLHLARSPEELEVARAIKRALDPAGVMNPAVLRPPMPRAAAAPL